MKYMNNPYKKLFWNVRFNAAPDGGEGGADDGLGDNGGSSHAAEDQSAEPSIEDLKIQLAKERAEKDRFKKSIDNLTKKNSDLTKQNRQYMSDEQKAAAEQEERNQELEDLRREVRVSKYSKRFVGLGMGEEDADSMAGLLPELEDEEAFFGGVAKYIEDVKKSSAEAAVQELLKNRPDINAGNGESTTSIADEKAVALAKSRGGVTGNNDIANNYRVNR